MVSQGSKAVRIRFFWACLALASSVSAGAAELGNAQLQIAGARLSIAPESQTVPFDTPTVVQTTLEGFDPAVGQIPQGLRVLADFSGPEVNGILTLETVPNEPFRIPRLSLKGEYLLDNIRLVQGSELLAYAEPRSAAVLVTQVLVASVSSRPLTLDEIRSYGIIVSDGSFQAFNFTFGFAVDGTGSVDYSYNIPIAFDTFTGEPTVLHDLITGSSQGGGSASQRFTPPQMAPFTLRIDRSASSPDFAFGGCQDLYGDCSSGFQAPLPGVILFPTDVSLLNQFFSVVLMAGNGAPAGDPLVIRDLTARVTLPPGLRMAQTEPPTPLGVPIPVRVPGPDGRLGTADDLSFLIAQATGQAEVLVEGLTEGSHLVRFDLAGILEGLPEGPRPITGTARGAVLVRDPSLGITVTHPDVVRAGEEYSLLLTVTNTALAPANQVTVSLPPAGLSGVQNVGPASQTISQLEPGDAELLEFRLNPLLTGKVIASAARVGGGAVPTFELTVGVGENGIPLSPTSIILPAATSELSDSMVRRALGLIGLGFSLATAPPALVQGGLPQVSRAAVDDRVHQLAQAGRHVMLGEDPFDSLAQLAVEWTGGLDADWEWDLLRRTTKRGAEMSDALAAALAAEAAASSPDATFTRFTATTAYLPPVFGALAEGSTARLEIVSRTSGKALTGTSLDPQRSRELPFGDLFDLGGSQMALLAVPEAEGYDARLRIEGGGSGDLALLVPNSAGTARIVRWANVSLSAAGQATVAFRAADSSFTLAVDSDGDGQAESQPIGQIATVSPRPFTVLAARQSQEVDPSGHVVEVLFSAAVDLASLTPPAASRFELPGNLSNGGVTPVEQAIAQAAGNGLAVRGTRVLRVVFNNPVSPLVAANLTVRDVEAADGRSITSLVVPLVTTVTAPGGRVEGTVVGADGSPVPFAEVALFETDICPYCPVLCQSHRTAAVIADAAGRYAFDYVRQTECSEVFEVEARDPAAGYHASARARMRFVGQTTLVDILMLGRGTLRGRVLFEDGTVPAAAEVIAYSPVFGEGRRARVDGSGNYELREVPVGTVTLSANDGQGHFVFATVELESAGAVATRDLTLLRLAPAPTGDVRGFIVERDGTTPVAQAYVALYVETHLIGVLRSGADGSFDFGTVPAGTAEIQAFDGATGREGGNVYFDVQPDQVTEITLPITDDRGSVEGQVLLGSGPGATPVAGAVVWIRGTPFNTVADANGYYRIEDVYSGNRHVHAANLETGEQVSALVTVPVPDPVTGPLTVSRDLHFPLPSAGGGLAGQVIGLDGNPVVGAIVHLASGSQHWYRETSTDGVGRFVLADLGPGTYSVHAFQGVVGGSATTTIDATGATPFVDIRFRQGTLRGVVKADDGSGQLVGVQSTLVYRTTVVRLGLVDLDVQERSIQTEPDGTFELTGVLAGRYQLKAFNPFYEDPPLVEGILANHGQVIEHELLFGTPGSVSGVVYRPDGVTPAAGARVDLRHPAFSSYTLTADSNGRFRFELVPPQSQWIKVDAELTEGTTFRQARAWAQLNRAGQHVDVELVLPKQGTVTGRVRDANGNNVPSVLVTLREGVYPNRTLHASTDSTGHYSFTNVFAGSLSLSAHAPALGGLGAQATVTLASEGQVMNVVLTLEAVGSIEGEVRSPVDGGLVPSAEVTLRRGSSFVERTSTDAAGSFRFGLLPLATYTVEVFDPTTGRQGRQTGLTVASNNQVVASVVTLEARGVVEGTVRDPDTSLGVAGALVTLKTSSLIPLTTYSSAGADGLFRFEGIPQGNFTLTTKEPDGRRKASGSGAITFEDQVKVVDLVLEATGSVTGDLRNPPGQPFGQFANANTRIEQDGMVIGATLDNPYRFDNVIVGRPFKILVEELGGAHRAVVESTLTAAGQLKTLHVSMAAIGSVRVKVFDAAGNPVNNADLRVTNSSAVYGYKVLLGQTGAGNELVFTNLGAGSVGVSAVDQSSGLTSGSKIVTLTQDGLELQISVNLEPSGRFFGRVLLSDGVTPAVNASVVVDGPGAWAANLLTDSEGRFDIPAMPDGAFWLYLQEHLGPGYWWQEGTLAVDEVLDLGDIVLDDEDPYVVSVWPPEGATGVSTTPTVTVTLSEPVNAKWFALQGWVNILRVQGNSNVASAKSLSADSRTITVTANQPLASDTQYEVAVSPALFDLAGRHLEASHYSPFRTADVVPPAIVTSTPANGAIEVPVSVQPYLLFSEAMDVATLAGSALQLTDLTTGLGAATTSQIGPAGFEVTLTPVEALEVDHLYRLTIQGATDTSGNPLPVTTIDFRTADPVAPVIGVTAPAPGTLFTAGQAVGLTAEVTDNQEVTSVTFHLGGRSAVVAAPPFETVLPAPAVSAPTDAAILVEALDAAGNLATKSWTIAVSPAPAEPAPTLSYQACLSDGDVVLAGVARPVGYEVRDENGLASWELRLDGQSVDGGLLHGEPSLAGSYAWTPPLSANSGDSFTFTLEATDFAGNLISESLTFQVASGTLLSGGGALDGHAGADLVLSSGVYTVGGPLQLASLALLPGATLKPASGDAVDLTATGTIRVQCDATIDVSNLGFAGGTPGQPGTSPAWITPAQGNAGGSHGGGGGAHTLYNGVVGQPGPTYDSLYVPTLAGGGGAADNTPGGIGGGVIHLEAGEVVLGGELLAVGQDIFSGSGGAGGSVLIEAAVVRGGGLVSVQGGNSTSGSSGPGAGGGGGGGRIAIYATAQLDFDSSTQSVVDGGWYFHRSASGPWAFAASGTAFARGPADTYGRLVVANGIDVDTFYGPELGELWEASDLPALGTGPVTAVEVSGADLWITGESDFRPRWRGAWVVLQDPSGEELGAFRVAALGADGRLLLEGAGALSNIATHRGEYRFDSVDLVERAGLDAIDPLHAGDLTVGAGAASLGTLEASTVTVLAGAELLPAVDAIDLQVSGQMTVEAGAVIDLSATGYPGGASASEAGGAPSGVLGSPVDAGGSHGGLGVGYGQPSAFGEVFDSVYQPELGGGGGSLDSTNSTCSKDSQPGGGVLRIQAASLVLDGAVLSRGGNGAVCRAAGGAGGTVLIEAGALSGIGTIDVSGGVAATYYANSAGTGGGGRVAILADQLNGFSPLTQVSAFGGFTAPSTTPNNPTVAGPGTVFWKTAADAFGHLSVTHQAAKAPPATPLPALGSGTVGSITVDGLDPNAIWIEPQDPAQLFGYGVVGMWVRVDGLDFRVIDQTPDRRSILLAEATGAIGVGDSFRGLYKFDTVYVQGGAILELPDPAVVGQYQVDGSSSVIQPPPTPPTFATVTPGEGSALSGGYPFSVTAEVDDADGVEQVILTFAGQSYTDSTAPYQWQLVAPVVATATVQTVVLDATDSLGATAGLTRTVTLQPVNDPVAPVVSLASCPAPGDHFVPGAEVPIAFTASDTVALYRYSVRVNGALLESQLVAGQTSVAPALTWASPPAASPATNWTVEVEVEDVGGNLTTRNLALTAASGTRLLGDQVVNTAHTGEDLVLGPGIFEVGSAILGSGLKPASLRLTDGAVLQGGLSTLVDASGDLRVQCGGRIDADAGGYVGGQAPGSSVAVASGPQPDAGGSHGGAGSTWSGSGPAGDEYGSVYLPAYPGGGGTVAGAGARGGNGGGRIELRAGGVLVIDGLVTSRGEQVAFDGAGDASGAGGTIYLTAPSVGGGGFLDASGGDYRAGSVLAGSGGGGRVAIWYDTSNGLDPLTQISARGGARIRADGSVAGYGAPGTIVLRPSRDLFSGVLGELIVDQGGTGGAPVVPTRLMEIAPGTVGSFTSSFLPESLLVEAADPSYQFPSGLFAHWLRIEAEDYLLFGTTSDRTKLTVLDSAGLVEVGDAFEGIYPFDKVTVRGGATLEIPHVAEVGEWVIEPGSSVSVLDEEAPTMADLLPAAGTSFSSGQLFTVSGTFADNIAVAEAVVDLGGYTFRSNAAPFSLTVAAPVVQAAADPTLTLSIHDFAGNVSAQSWTIHVEPVSDASAPSVSLAACPAPGDLFAPGGELQVSFTAADNLGLYRYTLLADGVAVDGRPALGESAATLTWAAPAGLTGGVASNLVVEVEDVGGNTSTATLALVAASGTVLVGDQVIAANPSGQQWVLGPGRFEISPDLLYTTLTPATLTLTQGAFLTKASILTLSATGDVAVQCGAMIDVSGRGYAGGTTPGVSAAMTTFPEPDSGGSFGGRGSTWAGPGPASDEYGSVYLPGRPGGGGSAAAPGARGGNGGGSIRLNTPSGSIVMDGALVARGEEVHPFGEGDGSGAGGTISLFATSVSGGGLLDASGGDYRAGSALAGSGGGGRISIWADDLSGAGSLDARAHGGARMAEDGSVVGYAAAGTLVVRASTDLYASVQAELIVDQGVTGSAPVVATRLPFVGSGTIGATAPLTFINGHNITPADPAALFASGMEGCWIRVEGADFRTLGVTPDRRSLGLFNSDGLVEVGDSYQGIYPFSKVTVRGGAQLEIQDPVEAGQWVIESGSSVTPPPQ